MFKDWYVGMRVVYTHHDEEADEEDNNVPFEIGEVVTISWIGMDDLNKDVMIDLLQYPQPRTHVYNRGYVAKCFAPVERKQIDISIFTDLLTPVKEDA